MGSKKCFQIKNLEERLTCLKGKFEDLTAAIEQERTVAMISDEAGNMHELFNDRAFIRMQIEITQSRIKSREKLIARPRKSSNKVNIGSRVKLENHVKSLDIYLVDENDAQPSEGFISILSPIGKAILGRSLGEEVAVDLPNGVIEYTIAAIQ